MCEHVSDCLSETKTIAEMAERCYTCGRHSTPKATKPQQAGASNSSDLLDTIPALPQRQDSTDLQLEDLRLVANKLGMYDAADFIRYALKGKMN